MEVLVSASQWQMSSTDIEQSQKSNVGTFLLSLYQSINQSDFYSVNIPVVVRLCGTRSKSVFNSKLDEAESQNRMARVVTKSPPFTRPVSLLRFLHCLPIKFRILFKISLLT